MAELSERIDERSLPEGYTDPQTAEEAHLRLGELRVKVEMIQARLADKNRLVDGRRLTAHEFHEWRRRALAARSWAVVEMRLLKAWLQARPTVRPWHDEGDARAGALAAVRKLAAYAEHLERRVAELEAVLLSSREA